MSYLKLSPHFLHLARFKLMEESALMDRLAKKLVTGNSVSAKKHY